MIRLLTSLILVLAINSAAFSQQDRAMEQARKDAQRMRTRLTVRGNVTAQAVLIPRVNARRIFGAEIANNYAIIEINVGNKSPDAALIIHGIFIDYSHWALSGNTSQASVVDGLLRESAEPFQASTVSNQIASAEYRVVRGQLLDAQMWSARNWTMRILTLAGSLASAFSFSIGEEGIVKGLTAFSGVAVPGLKEAWPDGTIEQLNRISDFGYQTNKVIAKQGGEVIVCFFPIDRFLTPGFKKLFQRSPALFFAPLQMLVDPALRGDANKVLRGINDQLSVDTLAPLLPCYLQITNALKAELQRPRIIESKIQGRSTGCETKFGLEAVTNNDKVLFKVNDTGNFEKFMALDFISQMSLNNVTVVVDGVMTVDTTTIRAQTDGITFERLEDCGEASEPCYWADLQANDGVRTAKITGAYLTGGQVVIAEAADLGITEITTDVNKSTDQELYFSFKLTKAIEPQTIHLVVSKPQPGSQPGSGNSVDSLERLVPVGSMPKGPPKVEKPEQNGQEITVKGSGFYDVPPTFPLNLEVTTEDGTKASFEKLDTKTSTELKLTITDPKPVGCVNVVVSVGAFTAPKVTNCPN